MSERTTIYDIAHTAGVSPATVSRMIHQPYLVTEATRQRILQAFEAHNITPEDLAVKKKAVPASRKEAGTSRNILVSVPSLDNPFYHDILNAIRDYLDTELYHMIISTDVPSRTSMPSFINFCSSLQIAGIIMMCPMTEDSLRQLHAFYPVVQCSEYNPFYRNVPYVSIDDYVITRTAVNYLVSKGCKKIAFFSGPLEYRHAQNRYRAYSNELSACNIDIRQEYLIQVSDYSYDRILAAAEQFYRLPNPPDAVFAISDEHAHAVIKAGILMGFRIPEDIKVFGFDDTVYSILSTPAISTVSQPRRELGMESARMLMEMINNPDVQPVSILLPTELRIRGSTGGQSSSSTYRNR